MSQGTQIVIPALTRLRRAVGDTSNRPRAAPYIYPGSIRPGTTVDGRLPWWPAFSIGFLCLIAIVIQPAAVSFLCALLLSFSVIQTIARGSRLDPNLMRILAVFAVLVAIGAASGIGNPRYLYLKDGWYMTNAPVIIATGFVLYRCMPDLLRGLYAFVFAGIVASIWHLAWFVLHPELLDLSANAIRQYAGGGYLVAAVALLVVIGTWRASSESLAFPTWLRFTGVALCGLSVAASFSRTILVVVLIGLAGLAGWLSPRRIPRTMLLSLSALAVLSLALGILSWGTDLEPNSFLGKLAHSFKEVEVHDYYDTTSINENWRGFETARALSQFASDAPLQWVFGEGFGAQVDLGFFQSLTAGADGRMRFIPIFHNGYVYLLIKTGIAGLLGYLYFLYVIHRVGGDLDFEVAGEERALCARLIHALAFSLAATTWIISGAFNKLNLFPVLLMTGFLIGAIGGRRSPEH